MIHRLFPLLPIALLLGTGFAVADPVIVPETDTLKSVYGKHFDIGVAVPANKLAGVEWELVAREFNTITPENCMKPPIHTAEDVYNFADADSLVEEATKRGLKINGHTLVWHIGCPTWFFDDNGKPASRELALKRLRDHIHTVVGRYKGKVFSYDVANEVLANEEGVYLRPTPWLKAIGEDYVIEAFRAAAEADPAAKLYYNDYTIEMPSKREKALRLVRELKAAGVPIHGIGIQGHWELDRIPFKEIEDSIVAFKNEGLEVMITELDLDVLPRKFAGADLTKSDNPVVDLGPMICPPEVLKKQADQYAQLFALFLKHSDAVTRVTFWGLHDGRTWLNGWPQKRNNHPLFWDRAMQPKPALPAVLQAGK